MLRTWRTGPKAALWCTFFLPASHPLLLFFLACPGKRAGGQDHHSLVQRRTIVFLKYNFILVPVGREDWCWQRVYLTNYRQVSIIKVGIAADHLSPLAALEAGPAEIAVVHNVPAVQTNTRIRSFCLMIAATASAGATGSTKHCDEDDVQAWWLVGWVAGWLAGWMKARHGARCNTCCPRPSDGPKPGAVQDFNAGPCSPIYVSSSAVFGTPASNTAPQDTLRTPWWWLASGRGRTVVGRGGQRLPPDRRLAAMPRVPGHTRIPEHPGPRAGQEDGQSSSSPSPTQLAAGSFHSSQPG